MSITPISGQKAIFRGGLEKKNLGRAKMENIVINVKNLTKTYNIYKNNRARLKESFYLWRKKFHYPFHALLDVSVDIRKGETIGIVGCNGSGKSTFLQIICGILQASSGSIDVKGRISALLELGAGFNPQFTGRQNVYLNGAILGLRKREIDDCFERILSFSEIGEFIDQPVKTYSSGMYVRLAFSIAINVKPDILIIDEALSVGDTLFQSKCYGKFKEFQKQGVTILFVTHSLSLITQYCSRAFLLEKGRICADGAPKNVVDDYSRMLVASNSFPDKAGNTDPQLDIIARKNIIKNFKINPNENRYGNGNATILDGGIYSLNGDPFQSLIQGEEYEFRVKVKFNKTMINPILAFTIKDVKGVEISGTNTQFHNCDTGVVNPGDILEAGFRHKMLLNPGGYLLSLGCAGYEDEEYVVYERRYDYLAFDVISTHGSVGIFDLDSFVSVSRN